MILFTVIVVFVIVLLSYYLSVEVGTHWDMVDWKHVPWAWGTFKDFKRMFSMRTWEKHQEFHTSWFQPYNSEDYYKWYIHAGIIIFDGVGMKLYPWSFVAYQCWSLKHRTDTVIYKIHKEWM